MAKLSYTVQLPGEGANVLGACRHLCTGAAYTRLTGMYAFASEKGARLLVAALRESPYWAKAHKRWIISIDGGITEPGALRYLLGLHRSEVRVPHGEDLLASHLKPKHRFHPKTLLLERGTAKREPIGILVGSANMTVNGLCFGHEHAFTVSDLGNPKGIPHGVTTGLVDMEKVIAASPVIDPSFADKYEAIRPKAPSLPEEFEDKRADLIMRKQSVLQPLASALLAASRHFWIDVEYVVANRGAYEEGNQIDMKRGSRVYFGFSDEQLPKNTPIGQITIRYKNHFASRNLRFGNNMMDKLDLPIPTVEGPPSYANQTLLFTRNAPGVFELQVGSKAEISRWKAHSRAIGGLFTMQSGREYGVF